MELNEHSDKPRGLVRGGHCLRAVLNLGACTRIIWVCSGNNKCKSVQWQEFKFCIVFLRGEESIATNRTRSKQMLLGNGIESMSNRAQP